MLMKYFDKAKQVRKFPYCYFKDIKRCWKNEIVPYLAIFKIPANWLAYFIYFNKIYAYWQIYLEMILRVLNFRNIIIKLIDFSISHKTGN